MGISKDSPLILFSRLFFLPVPLLFPWLFSFLSRFQNTVAGTFRFSVYLAMKNFGRTLLLTLQLTLFLLICWMIPFLTPFLPGVFCMLMSLTIEPVFREMTSDMGAENEDAWYNE